MDVPPCYSYRTTGTEGSTYLRVLPLSNQGTPTSDFPFLKAAFIPLTTYLPYLTYSLKYSLLFIFPVCLPLAGIVVPPTSYCTLLLPLPLRLSRCTSQPDTHTHSLYLSLFLCLHLHLYIRYK